MLKLQQHSFNKLNDLDSFCFIYIKPHQSNPLEELFKSQTLMVTNSWLQINETILRWKKGKIQNNDAVLIVHKTVMRQFKKFILVALHQVAWIVLFTCMKSAVLIVILIANIILWNKVQGCDFYSCLVFWSIKKKRSVWYCSVNLSQWVYIFPI